MKKTTTWGGTRRGAGRYIRRLTLSAEAARSVKILLLSRQQAYTDVHATALIESLIEAEWHAYDAALQADAEREAADDQIL